MRPGLLVFLIAILSLPLQAQVDAVWTGALQRAAAERKPIVVLYRSSDCSAACSAFEKTTVAHPTIQRRLERVVFVTRPGPETSVALFDHGGTLRATWSGLPRSTAIFGTLLDAILAAAPDFERAVELGTADGELDAAVGLSRLGKIDEARAAIERAAASATSPATRQLAVITRAMLDARTGQRAEALAALERLIPVAIDAGVAADAWTATGTIHRNAGNDAEAARAYAKAVETAPPGSDARAAAQGALAAVRAAMAAAGKPVRLLRPEEQIVSGRRTIRTHVASADVARVVFTIDAAEPVTDAQPPFSATYDFGRLPQTRTIRAIAHDRTGRELGRDEITVNDAGEMFWLRLLEPREGKASGAVRVSATLRAPAARTVKRLVISWNEEERAVLTAAPWQTVVAIPDGIGVLRAVAELDDGRTTEDAVLLNASGLTARADVQLVELPIIAAGNAPSPSDIVVREDKRKREIEAVLTAADAPLTVGVVIDTSSSMQASLPDVQEAALRFLDRILGESDRAFVVTFDTKATLAQPVTGDRALLRRQILASRPAGSTALWDAMVLGLLQFEGIKGRRAMVVFSDGADVASRYRVSDVQELARRSNIPLYVIAAQGMGAASPLIAAQLRAAAVADLRHVTGATGGKVHQLAGLDALAEVYRAIEDDLRAQVLAVIRTDAGRHANDWRTINVEVRNRKGVRAPSGYYAPW